MNVWLVNQYAIPPTQPGITRHFSFAAALNRQGHDVTLIASSFDHVTRKQTRLNPGETFRLETIEGVRFLWLRTPPVRGQHGRRVWNMLVFAWRVWRRHGAHELAPPDVVVGSSPHPFGALAAWRVARAFGVPFVLEVRDLWPEGLVQLGNMRANHPVVRVLARLERTLYRNAARIITLWPHSPPYIAARGGHPDKIVWISNGVSPGHRGAATAARPSGPLTIMYLGSALAHEPIAHGSGCGCSPAGGELCRQGPISFGGRRSEQAGSHSPAQRRRLDRMVRFEAPIPKQSINDVITEADILILPLHRGGLYRWGDEPNKLFDYMAAARPIVIAVDVPSNPVAEAGAGLSVPAEDAAAMAHAIKTLLALLPQERWEMGLRGRRYVEAHHDMARLAERFEACLRSAVLGDQNAADPEPMATTPSEG